MAIPESQKKMVACTYLNFSALIRRTNNLNTRFSTCSVYLCDILIMAKKEKLKIDKKKKRIPVPKKPPKVEKSKKAYDRKKEKEKLKKAAEEEE